MAEYFPLLERAVAGLPESTPEARRAIYERARTALLGQLRNMDPPIADEDVARESTALDDAIARIEATFHPTDPSATPLPDVIVPQPAPARPSRLAPRAPSPTPPKPPGLPSASAPPVGPPPPRERPPIAPRADGTTGQRPPAPLRPPAEAAPAEKPAVPARPQLSARPLNTAPRVGLQPRVGRPVREAPAVSADAAPPAASIPGPSLPATATLDVPAAEVERPAEAAVVESRDRVGLTSDGTRPLAAPGLDPAVATRASRGAGFYLAAGLGGLLVAGIAFEAWTLRDRPEQLTAAQHQSAAETGGKLAERAAAQEGQGSETAGDTAVVPAPVATGSQTQVPPAEARTDAAALPGGSAASPGPAAEASQAPLPTATADSSPTSETPADSVAVTQRAALLVEAPQDPQKVKTYVGTVVWKSESLSTGQGQPLSDAVLADIDIPEAKLRLSMVMKRNLEPQLPASHTIELRFTDEAGNLTGPVKQIDVPQMRIDDSARTGDPLAGVPVAITDNSFLVGLARGSAEVSNTQMMQKRNWIDVSLLLESGRAAKITFEKGAPGQRIIDEAIRSWQSGG